MLTNPSTEPRTLAAPAPLTLDAIEVKLLRLPLVRPFETSFGRIDTRLMAITRVEAEGISGWGEIVAMEEPLFSYETVETSRTVIAKHFAPALLERPVTTLDDLSGRLARFRGHPMARAGL